MSTIDATFTHGFLTRLHAAVDRRDADAIATLCGDDVLWQEPAGPLPMLDLARQIGAVPREGCFGAGIGLWIQHVAAFRARARLP